MIIYVDENMPHIMAEGFNHLKDPIEVRSIKKEFGEGALDEEWIPQAGNQGACIITQDYNINRIRHQRALCEEYGLGMFYFRPPSKGGFSYWDMLELLVKHWPEIIKVASKNKRPFSYRITKRSSGLERLDG
jgi:hypothetical protein